MQNELFRVHAVNYDRDDARQALDTIQVIDCRGDMRRCADLAIQLIAHRFYALTLGTYMWGKLLNHSGKRNNGTEILRTRTLAELLASAFGRRDKRRAPFQVERSGRNRTADLVRRDRQRIDTEFVHIDGDMEISLNGIGVEASSMRMCDRTEFANGLHHAGLVVGKHDRDERHVVIHHRRKRLGLHIAPCAHRYRIYHETTSAQSSDIVEDRVVLNR